MKGRSGGVSIEWDMSGLRNRQFLSQVLHMETSEHREPATGVITPIYHWVTTLQSLCLSSITQIHTGEQGEETEACRVNMS